MKKLFKKLSQPIACVFILIFALQASHGEEANNGGLREFIEFRKNLANKLVFIESSSNFSDWDNLIQDILTLQKKYAQINRSSLEPFSLLDAQFQLRFLNSKLHKLLTEKLRNKRVSLEIFKKIEYKAHIFNNFPSNEYRSPLSSPKIEGVTGISYPLKKMEKNLDYYNYTMIENEVLYRGLRLRSGDILFNHTSDKPAGMFTAVNEKPSVFSHVAMIVILNAAKGRLPLVMDMYERGVRLIPLHHFFGPKVINYGEVFRQKNPPPDLEEQIDRNVKELIKEVHPYDLVGREERVALSCAELIPYMFERLGQEKIALHDRIEERIYNNILKFGFFERQYLTPNDILYDQRLEYVGYIDNSPSWMEVVVNDIIIDLFREKMRERNINDYKNFRRKVSEWMIKSMKNKDSLLGHALLRWSGFKVETFPVGDTGLMSAVNALDYIFNNAMIKCIQYDHSRENNDCYNHIHGILGSALPESDFFINSWRLHQQLRYVVDKELTLFNNFFE